MSCHPSWLRQAAMEIYAAGKPGCGNTCMQAADALEWLETNVNRLTMRNAEHEMFRHQHRDCDAMGIENQRLQNNLKAAHTMLLYLMQQFDFEIHYCDKCGHGDPTKHCDSADTLRQWLLENGVSSKPAGTHET